MKKDQVKVGNTYLAKVSDKVVPIRIDAENAHGGWDATNLSTNKKVRIKSAQRLRGPAGRDQTAEPQPEAGGSDADAGDGARTKRGKAKAGVPKPPKAKKPSGLDAAAQVLKESGGTMNTKAMVEAMFSRGLWKSDGKTPAATSYSAILREIRVKGQESRFVKTERGQFKSNG